MIKKSPANLFHTIFESLSISSIQNRSSNINRSRQIPSIKSTHNRLLKTLLFSSPLRTKVFTSPSSLEIQPSISTSNPQSQSQSSLTSPNPNYQTSQPRKLTIRSIETQPLISIVIQPSAVVTRAICRIHKSSRWVYLHSDSLLLIESSIRFSAECWMQTCKHAFYTYQI